MSRNFRWLDLSFATALSWDIRVPHFHSETSLTMLLQDVVLLVRKIILGIFLTVAPLALIVGGIKLLISVLH